MNKNYIIIALVSVIVVAAAVFAFTYTQLSSQSQQSTTPLLTEKNETITGDTTVSSNPAASPTIYTPTINMEQGGAVSAGITLIVNQPQNGQTFSTNSVVVKGKTKAKADIFINELELKADSSGNFSSKLTLEEGDNPIVIVAIDPDGNYAENELSVNYQPAE